MRHHEVPGTLTRSMLLLVGLFVSIVPVGQGTSYAASLYGVDSACDCLYTIRADGRVTKIGPLAQDPGESFVVPTDMAGDLDGTLYVVNTLTPSQLLRVDPATGDADLVGTAPGGLGSLAINRMNVPGPAGTTWAAGTLFAITSVSGFSALVVLDKSSGAILHVIGFTGAPRLAGLAFRSDGTLFGLELTLRESPSLVRINTTNGVATTLGYIGAGFGVVGAIAFDAADNLWATEIDYPGLWRVDESSGQLLCHIPLVGSLYGQGKAQGLSFIPGAAFSADCDLVLPARADIDPGVINLSSRAPWVTASIESSEFGAAGIEVSSLRLSGSVPAEPKFAVIEDSDANGTPDLTVKFSRAALDPLLVVGDNELSIEGALVTGEPFAGRSTVRVISPQGPPVFASMAPNPLNPSGVLTFSLSRPGRVRIAIFDVRGELVRVLTEADGLGSGTHTVRFDGTGRDGQVLSSGMYFYRVEAAEGAVSGRIVVLK